MEQTTNIKTASTRQLEHITSMLRQVLEQQAEIKESVGGLVVMRDALLRNVHLDNTTLEIILEVSSTTLYRWRNAPAPNNLPFYIRENGYIYYDFDEVFKALRKGQINARGFNRLEAIERMKRYREDILHSGGSSSWFISDK